MKLDELLTKRRGDLLRALREFAQLRRVAELMVPERLRIVPGLAFARGNAPKDVAARFALVRPKTLSSADITLPPYLEQSDGNND